jgi:hypothetical protein
MDVDDAARHRACLPLDANGLFITVIDAGMPFVCRV